MSGVDIQENNSLYGNDAELYFNTTSKTLKSWMRLDATGYHVSKGIERKKVLFLIYPF
jgi:hypothetical protein